MTRRQIYKFLVDAKYTPLGDSLGWELIFNSIMGKDTKNTLWSALVTSASNKHLLHQELKCTKLH